ncbi:MAG: DUF2974 domain-containing protein [Peptococcaceae bacterium]|nr:DUF2974 domain-containing protein [Peptococcaceae bacterium]
MANVFDYLMWRGDLSLSQSGFNDVDNILLSLIAYIPFDGIVAEAPGGGVTLAEAAERFLARPDAFKAARVRRDVELLAAMKDCPRFREMRLSAYVNQIDAAAEKQFAALAVELGKGTQGKSAYYIAFRGTDNTLVGWKEDFNMSFMSPVPAQVEAARYLEKAAQALQGEFLIGGHSKGGNLAVYAAAFCPAAIQARIRQVYNNDGPGFDSGVLASAGHQAVKDRIRTFVPQTSVVGMLLEHEESYTVIRSVQVGLLQHDPYSWQIQGTQPAFLGEVSAGCRFFDRTIKDWVAGMDQSQREQFVDLLYEILGATNVQTLPELTAHWYVNARILLKSLINLDEDMRRVLGRTLSLLLQSAKKNLPELRLPRPELKLNLPEIKKRPARRKEKGEEAQAGRDV